MSAGRAARLLLVGAGYVVAVSAATTVTAGLIIALQMPARQGAQGPVFSLDDLPLMLVVGFVWTFSCALPGFVVAILFGERLRWDRWHLYALAGLANAAPSLAIFALVFGSPLDVPSMVAASFPGGFAGGAAYWLSAGRPLARRRYRADAVRILSAKAENTPANK